jgi:undecaprenyl diphosphate synthase
LPAATRRTLDETIARLSKNTGLRLTLALSYSGRGEIMDAARALAREVRDGKLDPDAIDDAAFHDHLYDPAIPDPDLLIRTSGELRVSNFLLWQIAYAEIWVTDVLWPDFGAAELIAGIRAYLSRDRRYGLHT